MSDNKPGHTQPPSSPAPSHRQQFAAGVPPGPLPDAEPESAREFLFHGMTAAQWSLKWRVGNTPPTASIDSLKELLIQFAEAFAASRDKRVNDYDVRPFGKLPESHAEHVEHWLKANKQTPAKVRWSLYPLGMVGRWIERAETAELQLAELCQLTGTLVEGLPNYSASSSMYQRVEKIKAALRQIGEKKL